MKSRFRKLAVESLEGRSVLSTMVEADFNNDGHLDVAALTGPNTITVSLNNGQGAYTVSDILSTPKNQPIQELLVRDIDNDGDRDDIQANVVTPSGSLSPMRWLSNDDGTFNYVEPFKWRGPKPRWI